MSQGYNNTTPLTQYASYSGGNLASHRAEVSSARSLEFCIFSPFYYIVMLSSLSCMVHSFHLAYVCDCFIFFIPHLSFSPCFTLRETVVETDFSNDTDSRYTAHWPVTLLFGEMVFRGHLAGKRGQTQVAFVLDLYLVFWGYLFWDGDSCVFIWHGMRELLG